MAVSENFAKEQARLEFDYALREMAANVMRVARGAGNAAQLGDQIQKASQAISAYEATLGHMPSTREVSSSLDIGMDPELLQQFPARERAWAGAKDQILRGALQMCASRLLGQNTQGTRGFDELIDGVSVIEEIRAANWAARGAPEKPPRTPGRRRSKR